MIARYEKLVRDVETGIWAEKYKNLENLPHWHVEHEIIHCDTGKLLVTLNGQHITLYPGDTVYCSSRDIHHIYSESSSVTSTIFFNPLGLPHNFPNSKLQTPIIRSDTNFHSTFDIIYREVNERPPYFEDLCFAVVCQYLLSLKRFCQQAHSLDKDAVRQMTEQNKLIEVLTTTSSYITFQDAAKMMGYSKSYFCRYFRNTFGVTFSQFMNAQKIGDAIFFLICKPEFSITQVASLCGFDTIRHFNRIFKELVGVSPSTFVRNNISNTVLTIHSGAYFNSTLPGSVRLNYFEECKENTPAAAH